VRPATISPTQAIAYSYSKDPIFDPNGEKINAIYIGPGAETLHLIGTKAGGDARFERLCHGQHPDSGEQIVDRTPRINPETSLPKDEIAALDFAGFMPKSLSVFRHRCSDPELKAQIDGAVWAAAKETANVLERYVYYRETKDGVTSLHKGKGIIKIEIHSDNRFKEEHIHPHFSIMNMVETDKGDYKALYNNLFYDDQKYLTSINQSFLARELQKIPQLAILADSRGGWELVGASQKQIEAHSTRRQSIKEKIAEMKADPEFNAKYPGMSDEQLQKIATNATKPAKDADRTEAQLLAKWEATDAEIGVNNAEVEKTIIAAGPVSKAGCPFTTDELVSKSAEMCHESESVFSAKDVISKALILSRGAYDFQEIEAAYERGLQKNEIVKLEGGNTPFENKFSSAGKIKEEGGIFESVISGKDKFEPFISLNRLAIEIEKFEAKKGYTLTDDQQAAAAHILCGKDQFVSIQGDPGTGKTTSFEMIKDVLDAEGVAVIGVSKVGKAAGGIRSKDITSFTLDKFLANEGQGNTAVQKHLASIEGKRVLILMDEASLTESRLFSGATNWSKDHDARCAIVGDTKQSKPIGSGDPQGRLQEAGIIDTVRMVENVRQKNKAYRDIVDTAKDETMSVEKRVEDSFAKLAENGGIVEIGLGSADPEGMGRTHIRQLEDGFVAQYLSTGAKETTGLCPTNETRIRLNEAIHNSLMEGEELTGAVAKVQIRDPKRLSEVEKCFAVSYKAGDIVIANKNITLSNGQELKAGSEFDVIASNQSNKNYITLVSRKGEDTTPINLELKEHGSNLSVYEPRLLEIAVGDKILATKNNSGRGIDNGDQGFLTAFDPQTQEMSVEWEKGTVSKFTPKQYPYFDAGYVLTTPKSQGMTAKYTQALLLAGTNISEMVNNNNSGLVIFSRGEETFKLFTDSVGKYVDETDKLQPGLMEQTKRELRKTSTTDYLNKEEIDTLPAQEAVEEYEELSAEPEVPQEELVEEEGQDLEAEAQKIGEIASSTEVREAVTENAEEVYFDLADGDDEIEVDTDVLTSLEQKEEFIHNVEVQAEASPVIEKEPAAVEVSESKDTEKAVEITAETKPEQPEIDATQSVEVPAGEAVEAPQKAIEPQSGEEHIVNEVDRNKGKLHDTWLEYQALESTGFTRAENYIINVLEKHDGVFGYSHSDNGKQLNEIVDRMFGEGSFGKAMSNLEEKGEIVTDMRRTHTAIYRSRPDLDKGTSHDPRGLAFAKPITTGAEFVQALEDGKRYDKGKLVEGYEQTTVINKGRHTGEDYERDVKGPDGSQTNVKWTGGHHQEGIPRAKTEFIKACEEGRGDEFARTYHAYNGSDAVIVNPERWARAIKEPLVNVAYHNIMKHLGTAKNEVGNYHEKYVKNHEGDLVLKTHQKSHIAPGISTKFSREKTATGPDRGQIKTGRSYTFGKASWGTSVTRRQDGTITTTKWAGNINPVTGKFQLTSSKTTINNKNPKKAYHTGIMRTVARLCVGTIMSMQTGQHIKSREDCINLDKQLAKQAQDREVYAGKNEKNGKEVTAEKTATAEKLQAIVDRSKLNKIPTPEERGKVNAEKVMTVLKDANKAPMPHAVLQEKLKAHMTGNELKKSLDGLAKDTKIKPMAIGFEKVKGQDGKETGKSKPVMGYMPSKEYTNHIGIVKGAIDGLADKGIDTFSRKMLDMETKHFTPNATSLNDSLVNSIVRDMSKEGKEIQPVKSDKFSGYEITGAKEAKKIQKTAAAEIMAKHDKSAMSVNDLSKALEGQGMKVSGKRAETLVKEMGRDGKVMKISDSNYALKERSKAAYEAAPFQERTTAQKANEETVKMYIGGVENKNQSPITKEDVVQAMKGAKQNMDPKTIERTMEGMAARQEIHVSVPQGDVKTFTIKEPKIEVSKAKIEAVTETGKDAKTANEFITATVNESKGTAIHSAYSGLKEATEKRFGKDSFQKATNELAKDEKITVRAAKDGVMISAPEKQQSKDPMPQKERVDVMPSKEKIDVMGKDKANGNGKDKEAKAFSNSAKLPTLDTSPVDNLSIAKEGAKPKEAEKQQKGPEKQNEKGGVVKNFDKASSKGNGAKKAVLPTVNTNDTTAGLLKAAQAMAAAIAKKQALSKAKEKGKGMSPAQQNSMSQGPVMKK